MTSLQHRVEGRPYPDLTTTDDEDMDTAAAFGAGILDGEDCGASGCGPPQYDQEYEQYGDDLMALGLYIYLLLTSRYTSIIPAMLLHYH